MKLNVRIISIAILGIFLNSCSKDTTVLQFLPHMTTTPNLKPQRGYDAFGDGAAVRLPPEGTLARGVEPYHFTDAEDAGANLKNPLAVNQQNLNRGKRMYDIYCQVCHGDLGNGDGPVVPPFPIPKSLHSEAMRTWKDGHLFHVVTMGQGIMPSYAQQVLPEDRWAIILYIRALQRSQNPSAADVEAYNKAKVK